MASKHFTPGSGAKTDEEKKRLGTFRQDKSEAAQQARREKVIAGPWLPKIPEPTLPLTPPGRKKYDELTQALFDQNKLTTVTANLAEQYATLFQEQFRRMTEGKPVPAYFSDKMQRALSGLKISEDAAPITNPQRANKFQDVGFSNRARPAR